MMTQARRYSAWVWETFHKNRQQTGKTVLDKQNLLTTTTAEEIAFWNGGQKIAYINANKMYFPSGSLTAYEADISGKITATSGEIGHCKITDCELMGSLSVYPKSGDTARKGIMGFDTYQDHFGDMREALLIKHEVGIHLYLSTTYIQL